MDDEHDDTVHHEDSDIDIRGMAVAALVLAVMTAFCYVAVYVTVTVLGKREAAASAVKAYPMAVGQAERLPPLPRLQTDPKKDLRDLRAEEQATLDSYQWVDRNGGVVRIPIDDAMRLVLQRGLPARPAQAPATAAAPAAPAETH
jgi:hypothetical protein